MLDTSHAAETRTPHDTGSGLHVQKCRDVSNVRPGAVNLHSTSWLIIRKRTKVFSSVIPDPVTLQHCYEVAQLVKAHDHPSQIYSFAVQNGGGRVLRIDAWGEIRIREKRCNCADLCSNRVAILEAKSIDCQGRWFHQTISCKLCGPHACHHV